MSARAAPSLFRTTRAYMDTPVTVVIAAAADDPACAAAAERAFAWFAEVEARCSRFDPRSELRALCERPGEPVPVSPLLFAAIRFACAVAERSGGAFDPAVGARQQARGLDRNYRTGRREPWTGPAGPLAEGDPQPHGHGRGRGDPPAQPARRRVLAGPVPTATWRDVHLDPAARTVTLQAPLLLDLGAVAKGMAVDLAARAIAADHRHFLVDAGGDVFAGGLNPEGAPWRVGLRHPRRAEAITHVLAVTDAAVCSSGDYARPAAGGHHILDPRSGRSPRHAAACSVVAPSAMLADALATAAFVLGPRAGAAWLAAQGVDGVVTAPDLTEHATPGFGRWRA
jgi:thiamine biosynthesis lipoprotein